MHKKFICWRADWQVMAGKEADRAWQPCRASEAGRQGSMLNREAERQGKSGIGRIGKVMAVTQGGQEMRVGREGVQSRWAGRGGKRAREEGNTGRHGTQRGQGRHCNSGRQGMQTR